MLFHFTSLRQTDSGMFSARVGRSRPGADEKRFSYQFMTQQTEIPNPGEQRAGHHWKAADRVAEYVQNTDTAFPEAPEVYGIITATQPFESDAIYETSH
jgi:hypothetical protein